MDNQSFPENLEIQVHLPVRIRRIGEGGPTEKSLGHCYQLELSMMTQMFCFCAIQYDSHQSLVAVEHLNCG